MDIKYLCFCKKCGRIIFDLNPKEIVCDCCKSPVFPIPDEYSGREGYAWEDVLRNKYVKTSPEFDQYLFDHRDEILAQKSAHYNSFSQLSVTCPYCSSTNTKKITATSKAVNTALFGIFGTKRHKQWHCNKCGSDF